MSQLSTALVAWAWEAGRGAGAANRSSAAPAGCAKPCSRSSPPEPAGRRCCCCWSVAGRAGGSESSSSRPKKEVSAAGGAGAGTEIGCWAGAWLSAGGGDLVRGGGDAGSSGAAWELGSWPVVEAERRGDWRLGDDRACRASREESSAARRSSMTAWGEGGACSSSSCCSRPASSLARVLGHVGSGPDVHLVRRGQSLQACSAASCSRRRAAAHPDHAHPGEQTSILPPAPAANFLTAAGDFSRGTHKHAHGVGHPFPHLAREKHSACLAACKPGASVPATSQGQGMHLAVPPARVPPGSTGAPSWRGCVGRAWSAGSR